MFNLLVHGIRNLQDCGNTMPGLSYLSHFTMNKQKCLICLSIKLEVCRAAEILSMACPTKKCSIYSSMDKYCVSTYSYHRNNGEKGNNTFDMFQIFGDI